MVRKKRPERRSIYEGLNTHEQTGSTGLYSESNEMVVEA